MADPRDRGGPDQVDDAQRLLGVHVQVGDRVRFDVVRVSVSRSVPQQRSHSQAPDSADRDEAWREWLQDLDTDESITPDVPAVVELARVREHDEV